MKLKHYLSTVLLIASTYCCILATKVSPIFISRKSKYIKQVLFLENFPVENSGHQWRASKWAKIFNDNNFKTNIKTIVEGKNKFDKLLNETTITKFIVISMWKRFFQIIKSQKYEIIIVRRELLLFNDYGNLFMEKFLLKIHNNVILDFDDDIAAAKREPRQISKFGKLMKESPTKFTETLKIYKRFIVGTNYLKNKLLSINKNIPEENICVIPTCVDYDKYEPKKYNVEKLEKEIIFGWIGGTGNLDLLDLIVCPLNEIAMKHNIKLQIISGKDYKNEQTKFPVENLKWSLATEVAQIKSFDIGLMPLYNNINNRGKCGFKLIQYMGLGIFGIATNITINGEIVDDEKNGFLVKPDNSNWVEVIENAISNFEKFSKLGDVARKTVCEKYSFKTNTQKYLEFIYKDKKITL